MNAKTKNTAARASFMQTHAAIVEKLASLQALADDHFNQDPEAIDWSHVGSLAHLNQLLDEAHRFITNTQA